MAAKKSRKFSGFVIYSHLKDSAFTAVACEQQTHFRTTGNASAIRRLLQQLKGMERCEKEVRLKVCERSKICQLKVYERVTSLRTADAFPVVASLSLFFGGKGDDRKCVCCSQAKGVPFLSKIVHKRVRHPAYVCGD